MSALEIVALSKAELDDWVAQATKQYIKCRVKGHREFGPYTARSLRIPTRPKVRFEEVEQCKCRTKRTTHLNSRGGIISSRYDYSECPGYSLHDTQGGRIIGSAKDRLRLMLLLEKIQYQDAA